VLEVLCLEVGTSVASAGTAETIVESIKCMCDVDMRGLVCMGVTGRWVCDDRFYGLVNRFNR